MSYPLQGTPNLQCANLGQEYCADDRGSGGQLTKMVPFRRTSLPWLFVVTSLEATVITYIRLVRSSDSGWESSFSNNFDYTQVIPMASCRYVQ